MSISGAWSFVETQVKRARQSVWNVSSRTVHWVVDHKKTTSVSVVGVFVAIYAYKKLTPIWREIRSHLEAVERLEKQQEEQDAQNTQLMLQQSFDENNKIYRKLLISLLSKLKKQIEKQFDIDEIFRQIKQKNIPRDLKLELWTKLKVYAICRFFLWLYGCCIASSLAAVQLSIIGRYTYVDEQVEESMYQSAQTNKKFLHSLEHVTSDGFQQLANLVEGCVTEQTKSLELKYRYSPSQMLDTFANINSGILNGLRIAGGEGKLAMCMLPQAPEIAQNGSHVPDRFKEMFAETSELIELESFDQAWTTCANVVYDHGRGEFENICSSSAGEGQNGIESLKIPLPKMIPLIVRSYKKLSDLEHNECSEGGEIPETVLDRIAGCAELKEFQKIIFFPMEKTGIIEPPQKHAT